MIRFHLDENVHHGVARGLRLRGIDVTTTTDAGLVEATDEGQFQYAVQQGRVLSRTMQIFFTPTSLRVNIRASFTWQRVSGVSARSFVHWSCSRTSSAPKRYVARSSTCDRVIPI